MFDNAVTYLQQLISRQAAMFHQYATLAALEQVVNVASDKRHDCISKYSSALKSILIKLFASKEEAEVAKVVGKVLKNAPSVP